MSVSQTEDINDTFFDELNAITAGIVSFISNGALIYATSKATTYSSSVRQMQMFFCVIRLLFSFSVILSSPTLAYVIECEAIFIVKGGIHMPIHMGTFMLLFFMTFVLFACTSSPVQFLQVLNIMYGFPRSNYSQVVISSLSFIIAVITAIFVSVAYIPDKSDDRLSEDVVYYLNGKGKSAYLIASLEKYDYDREDFVKDPISMACTYFIVGVLVVSTVIVLSSYIAIELKLKKGTISANSMKSQKQLNTVLIVQFLLPFFTIHIPFYFSFLMPLFRISTSNASVYLPYLFSWCPALSPILVICMIKAIREKLQCSSIRATQVHSGSRNSPGHLRK